MDACGTIAFPKPPTVSCLNGWFQPPSGSAGGRVITQETLTEYIRRAMPDAVVTVIDKTGTMDHLKVMIVSDAFHGKNLLDRHRLIYQALDAPMKDGRIHALELAAKTTDEQQ
jgi:stress-induced morphogen